MTARERTMIYILGGLALVGVAYLSYSMLIKPIREQNAKIEALESQIDERRDELNADLRKNRSLRELVPLTLPGNRELAEAEYETMLGRLLRDSKISGGKYNKQTQSESDPEPELVTGSPGKPGKKAYTKIIYSISFDKVTLAKLTDFLSRYNKVPLMHQIVKCSIKHTTTGSGSSSLTKTAEERTDLNVTLVTEAVLLDGAPERRTLFAIPDSFGAALGGVALNALRNDTEKSRNLTPTPDAAYFALSTVPRDYELLAARDPFHGPLPEYPKPTPPDNGGKKPPPPPPPPPYDHSPYIYLSSLVRTVEGGNLGAQVDVVDRYYDQFYTITISQFNDLQEMKIQRWTKSTKTDTKTREVTATVTRDPDHPKTGSVMEISDRASKPIRTFKVYGLNGNALILGEKAKVETPKEDKAKVGGGRPVKGAKPPAVVLPKPEPQMIALGGLGAIKDTTEKIYRWEVGQSLFQLKPLSAKDAKAAVDAAKKGLGAVPPPPPPPPPVTMLEEAPTPRLYLN